MYENTFQSKLVTIAVALLVLLVKSSLSFSPAAGLRSYRIQSSNLFYRPSSLLLRSVAKDNDVHTIQILMSDTGGGHRASANALRDALDVLHPGKFHCDIVDIYTDYGPIWPYNDYVNGKRTTTSTANNRRVIEFQTFFH